MKNSALIFALFLMTLISFTACKKDLDVLPLLPDSEAQPKPNLIAFYNPLDATLFYLHDHREHVIESLSIALSSNATINRKFTMPVMNFEGLFVVREIKMQAVDSARLKLVTTEFAPVLEENWQLPEPIGYDRSMSFLHNADCVEVGPKDLCQVIGRESELYSRKKRTVCRYGKGTCESWESIVGTYTRFRSRNCEGTVLKSNSLIGYVCQ